MKIAILQTSPVLLDVQTNLEIVLEGIHKARENKAELIVFPELALTGYFVGAQYHEVALRLDSPEIKKIVAASRNTAVLVGFIEESLSMNFYNSALVAVDGEIIFAYRKLNLPNYGVFEEKKYFANGKHVPNFRFHGFNIAVFICNDVWHPSLPYLGVTQKADMFIFMINSSNESMGDQFSNIETWDIINSFYSRIFGIYIISANRVGEEVFEEKRSIANTREKIIYHFWGGSEIVNPFGHRLAKGVMYEPDEIYGVISRDLLRKKKILLPYLRNDDPYFTHRELQRILYGKAKPDKF